MAPTPTIRLTTAPLRVLRETCGRVLDDVFPDAGCATVPGAPPWAPDDVTSYCPRCGASAGPGSVTSAGCAFCIGQPMPWQRLIRLGVYQPPLSDWIIAAKFGAAWRRAPWLGRFIAQSLKGQVDPRRTAVCAVPMHWLRRWRRGYNQSRLIAAAAADALGLPLAPLLHRTRYTPPQTSVPPSHRHRNVADSLGTAKVDLSGWDVIVVDDVKTTGATVGGCARLLRAAGARNVFVAVAAVADPRGQRFTSGP